MFPDHCEVSDETISEITDSVLEQLEEWQNRPLKKFYAFLFVDCLYVTIRKDYEAWMPRGCSQRHQPHRKTSQKVT